MDIGRVRITWLFFVATLGGCSPPALAQEDGASRSAKLQVGGQIVGITEGTTRMGIGAHAINRLSGRFAFEAGFDWTLARALERRSETTGLYFLLLRQALVEPVRSRVTVFATYGAFGHVSRSRAQPAPADDSGTLQERWNKSVLAPVLPSAGLATQYLLADHLAADAGVQLIFGVLGDLRPVTVRVSGGISVLMGRSD